MFATLTWLNANPRPVSFEQFMGVSIQVRYIFIAIFSAAVWSGVLAAFGAYGSNAYVSAARTIPAVVGSALVTPLVVFGALRVLEPGLAHHRWLLTVFFLTGAVSLLVRLTAMMALHSAAIEETRTLIVGTGPGARSLLEKLRSPESRNHHLLVGFIGVGPESEYAGENVIGGLHDLEAILMRQVVDEVYIELPARDFYQEIEYTLATCQKVGIECKYAADIFGAASTLPAVAWHGSHLFVTRKPVRIEDHELFVKRLLDIVVSALAIIAFAPLMLIIALAVKFTSDGPVLFVQDRYGLNKRLFKMLKFRTMVVDAEQRQASLENQNEASGPVFKIRQDPRVTPLGKFLRKTSLDELPQLFNVLRGHMSLVGPRPLPLRDVSRFEDSWLMRRFSVKPGLTCLWQVSGRSNTSFNEWIAQDLEYIDRWSMRLDLEILMRTVPAVVRGSGAM